MDTIYFLTAAAIFIIVLTILILMLSSKLHNKAINSKYVETSNVATDDGSMEDIIKNYFAESHWRYSTRTGEDSTLTFYLNLTGKNEKLVVYVNLNSQQDWYNIECQPVTSIPMAALTQGIRAMNNFNEQSLFVCGSIGDQGEIHYSIGTNIKGKAYSKESFDMDFQILIRVADETTAQIYKQACMTETAE